MLTLTKHHGLGNDFLVALDAPADLDPSFLARALCDRRLGVGADGLIVASVDGDGDGGGGGGVRMVLHNADGGRAELSGNGLRCLGQALVDTGRRAEGRIDVLTDAGAVVVHVGPERKAGLRDVRVGMGPVKVVGIEDGTASVDAGNPHLVLRVDDPLSVDLVQLGAEHADVNVEVIRVDDRSNVTMRVHERGAGITQACGTGSCAVVAATIAWGVTDDRVVVHNPGGPLQVDASDLDDVQLTGPAQRIARVEVDIEEVKAACR